MEQKIKNTIAEKVIKKIEEEKVAPLAKWHFVVKDNTFWALWLVSIIIGSCAVAASIFVFLNAGWQYEAITHDSFLNFFFDIVPLFWIISFALMIFLGYYNIRKTSRGYRFSFVLIVIASLLLSFLGGTFLYSIGVGKSIDNFRDPIPFAKPIIRLEEDRWNNSDKGLFSGVVKSLDKKSKLVTLEMSVGIEKAFSTIELSDRDLEFLTPDSRVRIIAGLDKETNILVACAVLPWEEPGIPYTPRQIHLPQKLESERNRDLERINICKDVRPYQRYKEAIITN